MATKIIYSDIAENMEMNALTKDVGASINDQSVKDSLLNLLLTNLGERHYNPTIGSGVTALLFENVNYLTAYEIKKHIETTVQNEEYRVNLTSVDVVAKDDSNEFIVTINFYIINDTTKEQTVVFSLAQQQV